MGCLARLRRHGGGIRSSFWLAGEGMQEGELSEAHADVAALEEDTGEMCIESADAASDEF